MISVDILSELSNADIEMMVMCWQIMCTSVLCYISHSLFFLAEGVKFPNKPFSMLLFGNPLNFSEVPGTFSYRLILCFVVPYPTKSNTMDDSLNVYCSQEKGENSCFFLLFPSAFHLRVDPVVPQRIFRVPPQWQLEVLGGTFSFYSVGAEPNLCIYVCLLVALGTALHVLF